MRFLPGTFERRPSTLLAAAAAGAYLLVIVGATTTIADAAAACGTWPLCGLDVLDNPALAVAWAHRLAAAIVGQLVIAACVACWRASTPPRVRAALGGATILYPLQIGVGALAATTAPGWVSTLHLGIGMAIFVGLVAALAWQLLAETPAEVESDAPDPAPATTAASTTTAANTTTSQETQGASTDSPEIPSAPTSSLARARLVLAAYFRLTKPRLMWLLCLVAAAGMALAAGPDLRGSTVLATLAGGVLAIGASGTFNHVLERDVDRRMERTADRPVATHEVPVANAVVFGGTLAVAALVAFASVNWLVAALGACAILFYTVIYTLVLKPNSPSSTVLGGAAGALPALIGWVAVTGKFGLPGLALAGLIFLWTPAHFYNLALAYKDDYKRGGFPLLPIVRGERVTRTHILWYLAATLLAAGALAALTQLGWVYASATVILGSVFLWAVVRLHRERTERAAFRAFHASNAFLGAVLVAIVLDAMVV